MTEECLSYIWLLSLAPSSSTIYFFLQFVLIFLTVLVDLKLLRYFPKLPLSIQRVVIVLSVFHDPRRKYNEVHVPVFSELKTINFYSTINF